MVFDNRAGYAWDSTKLTSHPIEKEEGVIKRVFMEHQSHASKLLNNYKIQLEKIKQ